MSAKAKIVAAEPWYGGSVTIASIDSEIAERRIGAVDPLFTEVVRR